MNNEYDSHEIFELRKMTAVLDFSINKFEMLKTKLFNYNSFKRIFLSIDFSVKKAEKEVQVQSERVMALKIKFSRALLLAFCTEFVFRYRFAFFILLAIFRILVSIGMRHTVTSGQKLKYILATYKKVERNSHDF